MKTLSTGDPSTLGTYRKLAGFFGPAATKFIDDKIAASPNGEDEEVIADEGQMLYLLGTIAMGDENKEALLNSIEVTNE